MRPELHNTLPHMEITATSDGYRALFDAVDNGRFFDE